MEKEIWKDIPEYEGIYQVSNLGRVKSFKHVKIKTLKLRPDGRGYLNVVLYKDGLKKDFKIHVLVAICFLNHIPNGYKLVVDHINNIKSDNRVENLQIVTQRFNASKSNKFKTSQYIGVSFFKQTKSWRATICIDKKRLHLGLYKNEYDAHLAYQNKLKEIENG